MSIGRLGEVWHPWAWAENEAFAFLPSKYSCLGKTTYKLKPPQKQAAAVHGEVMMRPHSGVLWRQ